MAPLELVKRRPRWGYVPNAPFESAIALASVISLVLFLLEPAAVGRSAVGHTAQELLPWWEWLYGLSGVLVLAGLFVCSLRVEVMGLFMLAAALLINAVAVADFSGLVGVASIAIFAALGGACVLRIHFLWSTWKRDQDAP